MWLGAQGQSLTGSRTWYTREPFSVHNWNLYFENAADAIREYMFEEIVYADDLNAYNEFLGTTENEKVLLAINRVQEVLYR